jgi:hypothetical protein
VNLVEGFDRDEGARFGHSRFKVGK